MDTTRADRLGCYGNPDGLTPVLDNLAKSGVKFNRFFCNVPLTLPSHATLMTGVYPPEHGCRVNGNARLADNITTLAETFSSQNYRTGAFVAAFVLDDKFGLNRGFDYYDSFNVPSSDDIYSDNIMYSYRRGDRVANSAIKWIKAQGQDPFFCWVHFFDPHRPYSFPEEKDGDFSGPYDQEVSFMDFQIGRLISCLQKQGIKSKTVVIAVGDHGEGLGEHGEDEHGLLLYNSVMRVPLIISYPGKAKSSREVDNIFSMVDLFPTILDIFGWENSGKISGKSFAETLHSKITSSSRVYLETEFPLTEYGWSPLGGLIDGDWKYILAPREELYNLRIDPEETQNLASSRPVETRRMKDSLEAIRAKMDISETVPVNLDAHSQQALESLGYIGSGRSRRGAFNETLRDPKDAIGMRREFINALNKFNRGNADQAKRLLMDLIQRSPESYVFRFQLARIFYQQGFFEQAYAEFSQLVELHPDEYKTHYNLGKTLIKLGRHSEAIQELELALELDQGKTQAYNNLGIAFLMSGNFDKAMAAFNCSLSLDANQVDPHNNIGNSLLGLGRIADAAREFKRSVEIEPDFFEGHYNLGICLLKLGKNRQAAREFQESLRLRPNFSPAQKKLKQALAGK